MALAIEHAPRSARSDSAKTPLTAYEAEQVRQIAAWKSLPPNPLSELWKIVSLPAARALERLIPDQVVRIAIEKAYELSGVLADENDIKRRAGVHDLTELRHRPLEECDRLSKQIGATALAIAAIEGAATGAGGVLTTLIDIPLLFVLALRTIRKVGHCYGYDVDHDRRYGREFLLGVLLTATSGSLQTRRERLELLREIEDLLIIEAQEEVVTEEALSFLFQLEVFEETPGVGTLSGALLNVGFVHRVNVTARRVFQEQWLLDNGKVGVIEPAEAHPRLLAAGLAGALHRAVYSGFYCVGFGAALPVWIVASMFRSNQLARPDPGTAVHEVRYARRAGGSLVPASIDSVGK
jgi:EcsC protein family